MSRRCGTKSQRLAGVDVDQVYVSVAMNSFCKTSNGCSLHEHLAYSIHVRCGECI